MACKNKLLAIKKRYTDTSESMLVQMIDRTWGDANYPSHKSEV
jgi:hypothetical protein